MGCCSPIPVQRGVPHTHGRIGWPASLEQVVHDELQVAASHEQH